MNWYTQCHISACHVSTLTMPRVQQLWVIKVRWPYDGILEISRSAYIAVGHNIILQ